MNLNFQHPLAVKIRKEMTRAINDYSLVGPGEKVMVAVSGGKDSTILALLFRDCLLYTSPATSWWKVSLR